MLAVGDFVEVCGLQSAPKHNTKQGRVFEIRGDGRLRLTVMSQLEGIGRVAETIAVKPKNAQRIRNYYTEDFLTDMVGHKMIFVFNENGQPHLPQSCSNVPIEVRQCHLGVGVFIKRGGSGVACGTDLFQERPLFSFRDDAEFADSDEALAQVMTRVDRARNHWDQDYYARMLLTGVEGPKLPVDGEADGLENWPAAVVKSRRFNVSSAEDDVVDIRPLCSLLNHSCSPSAVVSPLGVVTIWKDLLPGDEVTISYHPQDLLKPFGQRYRFAGCTECCCCPVCQQPEELRQASDERRHELKERAEKWLADRSNGDELEDLQRAMAVEGLCLETAYPRSQKRKFVM